MTEILRPAADWELQSMLLGLAARNQPAEVVGQGSLRGVGRPAYPDAVLTTTSIRGISMYEPAELVMSARAGTPLIEIEAELAARRQMLAFEPSDLAPATGGAAGRQTIGGVFATNASGPRRIAAGSARDHLLGLAAVNGRGELFKSGGRVMKNVTGYDVARSLVGSWGTLAVMTEVTFKVMPMPEADLTLVYEGLTDELAIEMLTAALGTPFEVSAAAHWPLAAAQRIGLSRFAAGARSITAIRIENFVSSVAYRAGKLKDALKVYGRPVTLALDESWNLWNGLRRLEALPFSEQTSLWRISTAPIRAPAIVASIAKVMPTVAVYDWSGGLIWLEVPASADAGSSEIRRAVAVHGGQATLMRAAPIVRQSVDIFEPMKPEIDKLTRGIKAAFDPAGLLNPGRMYAQL